MKLGIVSLVICAVVVGLLATSVSADNIGLKRSFTYKEGDGFVDVLKGATTVARYVYKNVPMPYIYPLYAPNGVGVTRDMSEFAGGTGTRPGMRSFWVGLGDVNGVDFWNEGEKTGRIKQLKLEFDSGSPGHWNIHAMNEWVGPDDKRVALEERRYSFLACDYGTLVSTQISIRAAEKPVRIADTAQGFLALHLADGLQMKGGTGHILNSEGDKDAACMGKRAKWCDYTGEVGGKTCGVTIFDGGGNHGYPTYWSATADGLLAADPFGGKAFTGIEKNDSGLTLKSGETSTFLYVTLIHDTKLDADKLKMIAKEVTPAGTGPKGSREIKPNSPAIGAPKAK